MPQTLTARFRSIFDFAPKQLVMGKGNGEVAEVRQERSKLRSEVCFQIACMLDLFLRSERKPQPCFRLHASQRRCEHDMLQWVITTH